MQTSSGFQRRLCHELAVGPPASYLRGLKLFMHKGETASTSRMDETRRATLVLQTHLCPSVTLSKTSCLSESHFPGVGGSDAAPASHRDGL